MTDSILLVEDDQLIVSSLTELLTANGYHVDAVASQHEAIALALPSCAADPSGRRAATSPYQLVLLDIALAEGNGLAVCGAIKRESPSTPVVFLTASGDEFSTVTGLELGADDYIAKPFRPRELLARIAGAIRRARPVGPRTITFGPLRIDPDRVHVERDGAEVVLSALEYRLLMLFATNQGKLITRDRMREALWDDTAAYIEENTLAVYIRRLRGKIEDDPAHPKLIVTVRGLGYQTGGC